MPHQELCTHEPIGEHQLYCIVAAASGAQQVVMIMTGREGAKNAVIITATAAKIVVVVRELQKCT